MPSKRLAMLLLSRSGYRIVAIIHKDQARCVEFDFFLIQQGVVENDHLVPFGDAQSSRAIDRDHTAAARGANHISG